MSTHKKKIIYILLDGIGDINCPVLNGKTPLQSCDCPTLDAIAKSGVSGLLDPVEPGLACGSDTAHLNIFGYNPRKCYRGRGSFESLGSGMKMKPGDIAFKCNFACLDPKTNIVVKRRASRKFEINGPILCKYLSGTKLEKFPNHSIEIKYATEHRCGVTLHGPNLTDQILGTDPLKDNLPLIKSKPFNETESAILTSNIVNYVHETFHKLLSKHEINIKRKKEGKTVANIVLLRGPGEKINVTPFNKLHNLSGFMIAPTAIIKGIGISIGLPIVNVKGATGDCNSNLLAKGEALIENITKDKYDFGFVHVKGIDDASHDGEPKLKRDLIQKGEEMITKIVNALAKNEDNTEYLIVVSGDHTTPCGYKDHSFEPVPFTVSTIQRTYNALNGIQEKEEFVLGSDQVEKYDEISVSRGQLGRFPGSEIIEMMKFFKDN
ncbi:cofactor-independent phosphoglycerate mutase [Anaeramoeba flamelloides]|uniref:Cofactor-independent phosphoglycerate mutase n=1 Tax=Anaeramoeba flamelloides TaxID=1746091 RepID=A0ABQ8XCA2_9EUKA|nr:cofactor-independent phosphoglycerate mutase [Anaeramoeba flamelloides]